MLGCSGLHYVAAQGNVDMTRMLCEAGANVNLQDKEGESLCSEQGLSAAQLSFSCVAAAGYTPLHMAVGYSFTQTVSVLLDAGADAETADAQVRLQTAYRASCLSARQQPLTLGLQGRSVLGLVDSLRGAMPLSRETMGRRIALEEVATLLASESSPRGAEQAAEQGHLQGEGGT